ncbi:MAG: CpsD/CapB family tyrosine-protein kinase [Clostridia bacterium]|nr:CpsD/CapB family tyrosine-protein kinase [Clostridia bacterium]
MQRANGNQSNKIQIITKNAPFQFVEAYKSLRTNLQFASVNKENRKIIVTSAVPGEGKSTVAVNLAIALAGSEGKVMLIDADLRKPTLHRYLHLNSSKIGGVTSVLSGTKKIDECLVHFNDIGINFLSSGPIPPNPAELLGSLKMEEMIKNLSSRFDYILFDTPPVSVVTDAAVLSKIADGVILVVKQNSTTIESAQLAKQNLKNVGASVIGCVLNNFKSDKSNKSSAYYHYKNYDYAYK